MENTEFNNAKKQYQERINKGIADNLGVLTDTIVEVFGEQHRELITSRIKQLNLLVYLDQDTLERAVGDYSIPESDRVLCGVMLDEMRSVKNVLYMDSEKRRKDKIERGYRELFPIMGCGELKQHLNENFVESVIENKRISEAVGARQCISLLGFAKDDQQAHSLIILPFLMVSDKTLVHEILHLVAFNEKNGMLPKSGMVVPSTQAPNGDTPVRVGVADIDENFTERKSIEIAGKLESKGVSVLPKGTEYEYSCYNSINNILKLSFERHEDLFVRATFATDRDVLKETLGNETFSQIAVKVYKHGAREGYPQLHERLAIETGNEICQIIGSKLNQAERTL